MITTIAAESLATKFSELLRAELGAAKMKEVVKRNRKSHAKGSCASHDFCDANMVMYAAGIALGAWTEDIDTEEYSKLWCDAWDISYNLEFEN